MRKHHRQQIGRCVAILSLMALLISSAASAQRRRHIYPGTTLVNLHSSDQLKKVFDRDNNKVRMVVLVSPTCPICRAGFFNIVKILKLVADDRVRAYVIWLPIYGGDFKGEAQKLSASFRDKRVSYFLDSKSLGGDLWEQILQTERETAWDVYLLYGAGAQWEATPPPPTFWMHQLDGVTKAPRLDEAEFRAKLERMLDETPAARPSSLSRPR